MYTICTYNKNMRFQWTSGKAAQNRLKHNVDFADAVIAIEDDNALTIEDHGHNEQRFKSLGLGPALNVLLVVHTPRGEDCIRIISARKADRSETRQYYQGLDQ
jgi:uncharacterized DUF497 family protein